MVCYLQFLRNISIEKKRKQHQTALRLYLLIFQNILNVLMLQAEKSKHRPHQTGY